VKVRESGPSHLPLPKFAKHFAREAHRRGYAGVMPRHVSLTRSHRISRVAPDFQRPALTRRAVARSEVSIPNRDGSATAPPSSSWAGFQPDPYVDYGRFLTPEGGILIIHKDHDLRFRHTLWRLFAWTLSTGGEGWFLFHHAPLHNWWIKLGCLLAVAILNWLIVRKPVEVYRKVEIRPDCLIIEGSDIFWLKFMECGWPTFRPNGDGSRILCGIYGTRFVEFLTIRSFDEFDRGADVFVSHLQDAMQQLWTRPPTY
jgi:hypothetical protein